jgi:uncharacterized RDD family membrane protein YckC
MPPKPKTQPIEPRPAGFVSRFAAWFIDQLVIVVGFAVMGMTVQLVFTFSGQSLPALSGEKTAALFGTAGFAFVASAIYMALFWYLFGSTLGQLLFGLRVVRMDGSRALTFWQVVVRVIGFYISMAVFFLGFLWILIDSGRRGWHDKLARTKVIYAFDAPSLEAASDMLRVVSGMRSNQPAKKG